MLEILCENRKTHAAPRPKPWRLPARGRRGAADGRDGRGQERADPRGGARAGRAGGRCPARRSPSSTFTRGGRCGCIISTCTALSDADELYGMGLDEYIPAEDGASFIEWPQMAQEAMPEDALHVHIAYAQDGAARVATLEVGGSI